MHINQKVLREYLKINSRLWKETSIEADNGKDGYIYMLAGTWKEMLQYVISGNLIAKSLQKQYHLPIISLLQGNDDVVSEINASFGIQTKNMRNIHVPIMIRIAIYLKAFFLVVFGNAKSILSLTCHGAPIGDLVYDSLLGVRGRLAENPSFTLDKLTISYDAIHIYNYILIAERSYRLMQLYPPRYIISRGVQREPGLIDIMALHFGATLISDYWYYGESLPVIAPEDDINESYKLFNMQYKIMNKVVSKELDDIPLEAEFIMNFGDDEQLKREDILERLHINNGKKNVLILPHCISDSPRTTSSGRVYLDYNEWMIDTFEAISDLHNVNWIFKDHPMSKSYGQEEYLQALYEKYHSVNPDIYWMDSTISGDNVRKIADAVLTDSGDAGCEYVSFGIPTVSASDTYYVRFGIGYQAKTKKQYYHLLRNIHRLARPNEEIVLLARKLMYLRRHKYGSKNADELILLCSKYDKLMLEQLKNGSTWSIDNTGFLTELIELYQNDYVKNSFYANYKL